MAVIATNVTSAVTETRRSQRYQIEATVDILSKDTRQGAGTLIDMSKDGAAFRCYVPLTVGSSYTLIIRDLGRYEGRLVRAFGCNCFAMHFSLTSVSKDRLEKLLKARGTPV